jgi:hypothetical protein
MSADKRVQGHPEPLDPSVPQAEELRPRFLGTADPDPLGGIPPGSPAEAFLLGQLTHPEGKPLLVELPTDPTALSLAAVEALSAIAEMLEAGTGQKKAGHDGPAKSNREVEDDER